MSDPLTPDDLARMRAEHFDGGGYCGWCQIPISPDIKWPCHAVRLLDEVERLRGEKAADLEAERDSERAARQVDL